MKQKTLGIVGGGQLGRMLVEAAKKINIKTIVLDPTKNSPAGQVADSQIVGDYKDPKQIKKLSQKVDFLTYEIESANADALKELKREGKYVQPAAQTLEKIQDKFKQKQMLKKAKIASPNFASVGGLKDIECAIDVFGLPIVLKARMHGFDGRGNAVIKTKKDINSALKKLEGRDLYVEEYVNFKKEIAIQIARDQKGNVKIYPVVETIQKNNICHIVIYPARISKLANTRAITLAKKVAKTLKGAGVFGIEMFLNSRDEVIVNEIAPRVHNSGHYTIEASKTSQFEQHVRAVCKLPLGSVQMNTPHAVMVNILGKRNGPAKLSGLEKTEKMDGVFVHIYGKFETRLDRKMGHITALGKSHQETFKKALAAGKVISI